MPATVIPSLPVSLPTGSATPSQAGSASESAETSPTLTGILIVAFDRWVSVNSKVTGSYDFDSKRLYFVMLE